MGDSPPPNPDIVKLNVGGILFTTTKGTLCRYPHSMLGAMFNGSMATYKDNDGYFIDRNGAMFGYVLDFLRSLQLALPSDFNHLDQLAIEADFYQIEPLITAIQDHRKKLHNRRNKIGQVLEVIEVRIGSTATMPTNNSRVKTIISGRRSVIATLPQDFFNCPVEKLKQSSDQSFTEIELLGSNVRLRLADYLLSEGWEMFKSDFSSSSGYDTKSMISSLIIEQSYRDRWFMPDDRSDMSSSCISL
jgi:hypothetical protein